jgi:hypothetical protein
MFHQSSIFLNVRTCVRRKSMNSFRFSAKEFAILHRIFDSGFSQIHILLYESFGRLQEDNRFPLRQVEKAVDCIRFSNYAVILVYGN